jgi:hypothetical protein
MLWRLNAAERASPTGEAKRILYRRSGPPVMRTLATASSQTSFAASSPVKNSTVAARSDEKM